MAARRGWLYQVPPLRLRPRRRRYYELHDAIGAAIVYGIGALVWLYEATIWLCVWMYYGLFLGARWIVQAIAAWRAGR